MATEPVGRVPVATLERLATYLRFLVDLEQAGVTTFSSSSVTEHTGVNAAQFRKDLSYFGDFGKPGVGYDVGELANRVSHILKIDRRQRVVLVGAGNLGAALVGYPGLVEHRFDLVAVFDSNPAKVGKILWHLHIKHIDTLAEENIELGAQIGIVAVPRSAAQSVADCLISAGIRSILNFAPCVLRVPGHVTVRNVSFVQELAVLSYHLTAGADSAE